MHVFDSETFADEMVNILEGRVSVWLQVAKTPYNNLWECGECGEVRNMEREDLYMRQPVQVVCGNCGAW